jgi:hypothetical protein
MTSALDDQSLNQIFRSARTFNSWADRPVEDNTVRGLLPIRVRTHRRAEAQSRSVAREPTIRRRANLRTYQFS